MWDPSISWDTSTAEMVLSDNTSAACRVCAHCLTWMSSADPKSVSLAWVPSSSRSTLSPTEPKNKQALIKNIAIRWPVYEQQQRGLEFANLIVKNSRVVHFARTFFIFVNFAAVFALSSSWNDLLNFCTFVDNAYTRRLVFQLLVSWNHFQEIHPVNFLNQLQKVNKINIT